jgi:hypothetical protein
MQRPSRIGEENEFYPVELLEGLDQTDGIPIEPAKVVVVEIPRVDADSNGALSE